MTERHHSEVDQLRAMLDETAEAFEPGDRLGAIRAEVGTASLAGRRRRRTWWAVGGASVAAVAAAVAAVAVLSQPSGPVTGQDPVPPAGQATETAPSGAAEPSEGASEPDKSPVPPAGADMATVPLYFVGDTPHGPRLYREFGAVPSDEKNLATVNAVMAGQTRDPDYRTLWPAGAGIDSFEVRFGSEIHLTLADGSLRDRPAGMTDGEAQLAIQQVIYTAQGLVSERLPVQFRYDGNPIDQVLGVPTSEPLAEAQETEVRSHVNITEPGEAASVHGGIEVTGVASSFEATLDWELRRGDATGEVVKSSYFTAQGCCEKLYPFSDTIDLAGVEPGTYTLVVRTADPSGGAEGAGPYVDTRTVIVE